MKKSHLDGPPSGVVGLIDQLIDRAADLGASDIHFEPTESAVAVRFRVDGRLHEVESIPGVLLPNLVTRLKVMAGLLTYRVDIPQEGGLTLQDGRGLDIRISTFPTVRGERVAVRLLPKAAAVRTLDELGLSKRVIRHFVDAAVEKQGLILVTGPAGSGKTTTLFAFLRHLTESLPGTSIMTLEDPVEYRLDGIAQIQVNPHGELTYPRALRSLLRQDPQIILLGEIRDAETAHIAIEAALTGHLLLSTMHGGSIAEAIVRLREMGIPGYQMTSVLRLVVSQRLLRSVCEDCRPTGARSFEDRHPDHEPCAACLGSGFHGRCACAEAAGMTSELRAAVLDRSDTEKIQESISSADAHVTLAGDALRHVSAGRTTRDEAESAIGGPLPAPDTEPPRMN